MSKFYGFIFFQLLAIVLATRALFAYESVHLATLANLRGSASNVEVTATDGFRVVPSIGTRISTGTRIKTQSDVSIQILFDDGSQMLIGSNTEVLVNSAQPGSIDTQLNQGRVRSKVAKPPVQYNPNPAEKPKYMIHIGDITLGVRGTDFAVSSSPTHDDIRVETLEGIVDLWKTKAVNFTNPDRRFGPGDGIQLRSKGEDKMFRFAPKDYQKALDLSQSSSATPEDLSLVGQLKTFWKNLKLWMSELLGLISLKGGK